MSSRTATPSDAEKLQLIAWLNQDLDALTRAAPSGDTSEDYGSYVVDLALAVAALHDKRALPAMVKVMDVSNGICQSIASFGDDAVAPVIAALGDEGERDSAVVTLGFLLEGKRLGKNALSAAGASRVQDTLVGLTSDPSPLIRLLAVRGLAYGTATPRVVEVMRNLSAGDPDSIAGSGGAPSSYPVREQAAATLQALQQQPH